MNAKPSNEVESFWEQHYSRRERIWSGRPNAVLVDVAGALAPGSALDLGCGEGGDAIWLAGLGWRVVAVDVSATALERASTAATAAGVDSLIAFERHDLGHRFPTGSFDLVSAQFLQSPVELPRDLILRSAARAVAAGGLLLIVEHGSVPPWSWKRDHDHHHHPRFSTPDETLAGLELDPAGWQTELLGSPEREALGPDGQSATITDNVVALRRRA